MVGTMTQRRTCTGKAQQGEGRENESTVEMLRSPSTVSAHFPAGRSHRAQLLAVTYLRRLSRLPVTLAVSNSKTPVQASPPHITLQRPRLYFSERPRSTCSSWHASVSWVASTLGSHQPHRPLVDEPANLLCSLP